METKLWPGAIIGVWIFLVILSAAAETGETGCRDKNPPKYLDFYMHDRQLIKDSTGIIVAAQNGNLTRYDFGTLIIMDDPLTVTPSNDSTLIGRGQGMYLVESRQDFHLLVSFSAYFEGPDYNGTIVFHGSYKALAASRELPIIAGTGDFRGVHGHAMVRTRLNFGLYVVLEFNCTLYYF